MKFYRALKLDNSTSDKERLLTLANPSGPTLETCKQKLILIEVYEIINDLSSDILMLDVDSYVTRNSNYGKQCLLLKPSHTGRPKVHPRRSLKSFRTVLWNSLPVDIKTADSLSKFNEGGHSA